MVHQTFRFTKMLSVWLASVLALAAWMALGSAHVPAQAMVGMNHETVDKALIYGMQKRKQSLSALLGSNWVEGPDGALLNVYTPFMMLAAQASKLKLSTNPTDEDLKKARDRLRREVSFYRDPKNKQHTRVKFSVSFLGATPLFHKTYKARIVGFGRGKEHDVKAYKTVYDDESRQVATAGTGAYEAINSYFFRLLDVEDLQEFQLILESPSGPPVVFRLNGAHLY